jgi:DNA-binding transcriptional LysR family regulator
MSIHIDTLFLKSFISVAEIGTFSGAAELMGRTQSAISLQIKKLESMLGCQLFIRFARNAELTTQGEIFLGYAKRIVELEREAYRNLKDLDVEGEITFGVPEDFATHYMPNALFTFHQHHPKVQLNVSCDLTVNLIESFNKGICDFIMIKSDPKLILEGITILREPLVWVANDNYEMHEPYSLVLSPQKCIYRARALAALDKVKKSWRVSYTSHNLYSRIAAVKAGLGITVLPENMLTEGMNKINTLPNLSDSEIVLLKRGDLSKASEVLIDYIMYSIEGVNSIAGTTHHL